MKSLLFLLISLAFVVICNTSSGDFDSLRVCVVNSDLKRKYVSRVLKSCAALDKLKDSPVKCLIVPDRFHCLYLTSIGKADFTLMKAEDLLIANSWKDNNILVVSEMRALLKEPYEYGVVAIVRNEIITPRHGLQDLRDKRFCHPGSGYELLWSKMYTEFFEETIMPPSCDANLTLYENNILASSSFFRSACKAGPWVSNRTEDIELKHKYKDMCSLCQDPSNCHSSDKYWGRTGSLICLTDGDADVAWARVDTIRTFFKLYSVPSDKYQDYSYLCKDGSVKPLIHPKPCAWLAKPWSVIGANRKASAKVREVMSTMSNNSTSWSDHLLDIFESYQEYVNMLNDAQTTEDYLETMPGFISAYYRAGVYCKDDRSIKLCTISEVDKRKCEWLSQAARVMAVQPDIVCIQNTSLAKCMMSVKNLESDIVVVPPVHETDAVLKYRLKPLLAEKSKREMDYYLLAAIVKSNSPIKSVADLQNRKACFTKRKGIGWNVVSSVLKNQKLVNSQCSPNINKFFQSVCVVETDNETDREDGVTICKSKSEPTKNLTEINSETEALKCLVNDVGDVAFINLETLYSNTDGRSNLSWAKDLKYSDFRPICLQNISSYCSWSWTYPGQIMTSPNISLVKEKEILNAFDSLKHYFGEPTKNNDNTLFRMFSPFLGQENVLFQDSSSSFSPLDEARSGRDATKEYSKFLEEIRTCAGVEKVTVSIVFLIATVLSTLFLNC